MHVFRVVGVFGHWVQFSVNSFGSQALLFRLSMARMLFLAMHLEFLS